MWSGCEEERIKRTFDNRGQDAQLDAPLLILEPIRLYLMHLCLVSIFVSCQIRQLGNVPRLVSCPID